MVSLESYLGCIKKVNINSILGHKDYVSTALLLMSKILLQRISL